MVHLCCELLWPFYRSAMRLTPVIVQHNKSKIRRIPQHLCRDWCSPWSWSWSGSRCRSRPLGLAARLEQVSFNQLTNRASVCRVIWTNHHSAINQHPSNKLIEITGKKKEKEAKVVNTKQNIPPSISILFKFFEQIFGADFFEVFVVATNINATGVSPPRPDQVDGQYVTSDATWKPTSTEEWRRDWIYWFNTNIVKSAAKSSDVKVESFMSFGGTSVVVTSQYESTLWRCCASHTRTRT